MRGAPQGTNVAFLKNLQGLTALCKKKKKLKLLASFIISIPFEDDSHENINKNTEAKTWNCRKCGKKYKTKNGFTKHEETCEKDSTVLDGNEESEVIDSVDSVSEVPENPSKPKEGNNKPQNKAKNDKTRMKKCMFCKKERIRIDAHYLSWHKIDYNLWIRNLTGNRQNRTTCPQCNEDFKTTGPLRKHLAEYHKICL